MNSKQTRCVVILAIVMIVTTFILTGCAGQQHFEVSLGADVNSGNWEGGDPTATFELRHTFPNEKAFCYGRHVSHVFAGAPFNDRTESYYDQLGCGLRFGL